jgi:hypothetical protein
MPMIVAILNTKALKIKVDANKSISNIVYNYLNLPEQNSISGKGTIA